MSAVKLRVPAPLRDERGMTLVMVLVCVTVIATLFATILNMEGSTIQVQTAMRTKRAVDLAADGAIDAAISQLKLNQTQGVDGGTDACTNSASATPLTTGYADPNATITVTCQPSVGGGKNSPNVVGMPASNVLLALGGIYGAGSRIGLPATDPNNSPFCDDNDQPTDQTCEAGIYIAHGTNDSVGILVAPAGGTGDLVASNGSIVADPNASPPRKLVAQGSVSARRFCIGVIAASLTCPGNVENNDFFADPAWKHEWWSATTENRGTLSALNNAQAQGTPGVNEEPKLVPWCSWDAGDVNRPSACPNTSFDGDLTSLQMKTIASLCTTDHLMIFKAGTYDNLFAMNSLMEQCPDTIFYFMPGNYYFDFVDVGAPAVPYWEEPRNFSQIIAGTPPCAPDGDGKCTAPRSWKAVVGPQPTKVMVPDDVIAGMQKQDITNLDDGNLIDGTPADINLYTTPSTNPTGTLNPHEVTITTDTLHTPLLSNDQVTGLELVIAESHETGLGSNGGRISCNDTSQTPAIPPNVATAPVNSTAPLWCTYYMSPTASVSDASPEVKIELAGDPAAECAIPLDTYNAGTSSYQPNPKGIPGTLGPSGVAVAAGGSVTGHPVRIFDLSSCANAGGINFGGHYPMKIDDWTRDKVNNMSVVFDVQRSLWDTSGGKNFKPAPDVSLDGMQIQVDYTGAPSPSYPTGCDPLAGAGNGVQWMFGNLSRMLFWQNDVWVDLCGEPGLDGRAIAVYAPGGPRCNTTAGSGATPPVCDLSAAPNSSGTAPITDVAPPLESSTNGERLAVTGYGTATPTITDAGATATTMDAATAKFVTTSGGTSWTRFRDGNFGYVDPSTWTQQGQNATLAFKTPSNWIPADSAIEHVTLRVRHAEPLPGTIGVTDTNNIQVKVNAGSTARVLSDAAPDANATNFTSQSIPEYPTPRTYTSAPASYASNCTTADCWTTWSTDDPGNEAIRARLETSLSNSLALNSALIQLDAWSSVTGNHQMFVDGIELVVTFRPPGQIRPVRGCLTTRTLRSDGPTYMRGTSFIHNGNFDASGDYVTRNDYSAYENAGGGVADNNACSLLKFGSQTSNASEGSKFQASGDLYAPTASIDMSGKANEAPFVTDGVVARTITARRWSPGRGVPFPTFGLPPTYAHAPRDVTLVASFGAQVIATAHVVLQDDPMNGSTATIVSWTRRQ